MGMLGNRTRTLVFLGLLLLFLQGFFVDVHAGTLYPNGTIYDKYGNITPQNQQEINSMQGYANGTIYIDISGNEVAQQTYIYSVTSYGNGTLNIVFKATTLMKVIASNYVYKSYVPPIWNIQVKYSSSQTSVLILTFGAFNTEAQSVLFKDDFLYQTNYLSNQWTVEQYEALTEPTGVYTQSGYLVYSQPSSPGVFVPVAGVNLRLAAVHVTNPAWTQGMDNTTFYKRKLTVSLIPYKINPSLGVLNVGFGVTQPNGTYPGWNPQGTTGFAALSGMEHIQIDASNGHVNYQTEDATPSFHSTLLETIDITLYTVITVEYAGLPNIPSTQWTYFRVYQNDANGNIITSTDKNANVTGTNQAPFGHTNFVSISQSNPANTAGIVSKIDLVQLQSYGSPVDLKVPLTIPFPTCASPSCPNGLIGLLTAMAYLMGLGNTQFGAINLFLITMVGTAGLAVVWTKRVYVTLIAGILDISMFIYAGLLPTWILFLMLLTTAFLTLLLFRALIGFGGGGDSPGGDSSEGGTSGGIE